MIGGDYEKPNESFIKSVFNEFDMDSSGTITKGNLVDAFKKLGIAWSKGDLAQIFLKHDLSHSGTITYDEFKKMLFDDDNDMVITELDDNLQLFE